MAAMTAQNVTPFSGLPGGIQANTRRGMSPSTGIALGGMGAAGIAGLIQHIRGKRSAANANAGAGAGATATAGAGGGGGAGSFYGPYDEVLSGYRGFAETGGFSPEDLANIRARAISPIRATYANAQREVNRNMALQGGYSPGANVLKARMAREQGQAGAEATTAAEADIAKMVQEGKLAGLGGMAGLVGREGGGDGGGAGAGAEADTVAVPEKKKGFWSKFGGALKKVGQVALPIALGSIGGPAGAAVGKGVGSRLLGSAQRQMGVR
jgi:hypothetical protein